LAATVRAYGYNGAGPTGATVDSADSASIKFGRDDLLVSTTSIPIPTSPGTKFSYIKWLGLQVTATSSTSISNRKISIAATPAVPTGISLWQGGGVATYTQNNGTQGTAAGNYPADAGTNGATPANQTNITWATLNTTATVYDNSSVSTGSTGLNGKYVPLCCGVDNTYTGGGGAATLPNVTLTYDEQ
jgi:hypothetical protein